MLDSSGAFILIVSTLLLYTMFLHNRGMSMIEASEQRYPTTYMTKQELCMCECMRAVSVVLIYTPSAMATSHDGLSMIISFDIW